MASASSNSDPVRFLFNCAFVDCGRYSITAAGSGSDRIGLDFGVSAGEVGVFPAVSSTIWVAIG